MKKSQAASPEFIAWLKEQLVNIVTMTRKIVSTGKTHVPAMIIFPLDPEEQPQIIPVNQFMGDNRAKDILGILHQEIASDDELVKAAMTVIESWVLATVVDASERDRIMTEGIENRPDKQEAIVFNCINNQGMQLLATYHISRPDNTIPDTPTTLLDPVVGIIEGLGKSEVDEMVAAHGRMVLPPEQH